MNPALVQSPDGVTLIGGAPVSARDLALARARAPLMIGVDGGADRLLAAGMMPAAVIGDLDSLSAEGRAQIAPARLHHIAEQATTDFDKALRNVVSPFILALGFSGARSDHGLAALNTLIRHVDRPCILLGAKDLTFAAPAHPIRLQMRPGDLVSLFPMARVTGRSEGLEWPIAGLDFAPNGFIGTSNRATARQVRLEFDAPGMLVILPRHCLDTAIVALRQG